MALGRSRNHEMYRRRPTASRILFVVKSNPPPLPSPRVKSNGKLWAKTARRTLSYKVARWPVGEWNVKKKKTLQPSSKKTTSATSHRLPDAHAVYTDTCTRSRPTSNVSLRVRVYDVYRRFDIEKQTAICDRPIRNDFLSVAPPPIPFGRLRNAKFVLSSPESSWHMRSIR